MEYINYLIEHGHTQTAKQVVWPIVSNDLNYVAQYWNQTGYDLWEEVGGTSFFTILAQNRALIQGRHIAHRLNLTCASCDAESPQIACFIANNFWNATGGYIDANINTGSTRSGIDANALLGVSSPLIVASVRANSSPLAYGNFRHYWIMRCQLIPTLQ